MTEEEKAKLEETKNKKDLTKAEENKLKMDEEDAREFTMRGKPYKEKYNGERISKMDYSVKYVDSSDKIHLNFPNASVNEYGHVVTGKASKMNDLRKKLARRKGSNTFKNDESNNYLKPNSRINSRHKKYTSQEDFSGYIIDVNSAESLSPRIASSKKLPDIKEHIPHASKMLEIKLPKQMSKQKLMEIVENSKANQNFSVNEKSRDRKTNQLYYRTRKFYIK